MNEKPKHLIPVEYASLGLPTDLSGFRADAAADNAYSGIDYLKLNGKTGKKVYGADHIVLPDNAKLAALIGMTKFGFAKWRDGAIETQAWLGLTDLGNLDALRQRLGDLDPEQWTGRDLKGRPIDPFRRAARCPMLWLEKRKPLLFSTFSKLQVNAVRSFIHACADQAEAEPKTTHGCVPIVTMGVTSREVHTAGDIYFPTFDILKWMPIGQVVGVLVNAGFGAAFGISNRVAISADPAAADPRPPKTSTEKPGRR
jgi:hypothetical protein